MRDVLVRVRDVSRWNCAVGYAGDLAAKLQGSLTGVFHSADDDAASHATAAGRFSARWQC